MNIYQTVPRIDCVRFAKCNKKSLAHCRKYRNTDSECKTCQLIRKRISNKYQTENEVYTKNCVPSVVGICHFTDFIREQ